MPITTELIWDAAAIRRAIRLLGSHSSRIDDPQAGARALRLIWDIVQRRGAATDIFQLPGTMPLVIVGHGPNLIVTHLDDAHPSAQVEDVGPPSISGETVSVPGITRKAGVLAALGTVLGNDPIAEQITLVIEADRHSGSRAFAYWLDSTERDLSTACCEIADLPVPAPALFLAATGVATMKISLQLAGDTFERVYGGVRPDLGHQLVTTLAAMKSIDGEVLVPGFYDDVVTPEPDGLAALQQIAAPVGAWLTRGDPPDEGRLTSSHLTLGAFLAPSLNVRALELNGAGPYLASSASAIVEARIMPGQNAAAIARSITDFVRARIPDATVDTLLLLPAAKQPALDPALLATIAPVLPVAPGNTPAGLLETVGIPTIGFSTVWRDPAAQSEHVSLEAIPDGTAMILSLVRLVADLSTGVAE
jgi:acetylornithine deacetylase/succinyl-diaminopimelate desuccinylase-like protein